MADDVFPTRVRFFDRQFLQAADLAAEQRYHLRMRWRHNLALHSWGILTGLEATVSDATHGTISVARGMAIDGYGRELVLPRAGIDRGIREPNADYDVLLIFSKSAHAPNRLDSRTHCGGTLSSSREVEWPRIEVVKTSDRTQSRADRPGEVPPGDIDFRADQLAPDDNDHPWPVLLGRLVMLEGEWTVDSSVRRYAGLIAERIEAPRRPDAPARTSILTGDNPAYSFAVVEAGNDRNANAEHAPPIIGVRRTSEKSHQIEFRSERVSVAADLVMRDGSAMEFQANPIRDPDTTPVLSSREQWRIYRHLKPPSKAESGAKDAASATDSFSDELRITMPLLPVSKNGVSIGTFTDKGAFAPILSVKNDGTVTVNGSLTVRGTITKGRVTDAPGGSTAGTSAPPVLPDDTILARAAAILAVATQEAPVAAMLKACNTSTFGQQAVVGFVPGLGDVQIKAIGAKLWREVSTAEYLGECVDGTNTGGARVGTFTNFLDEVSSQMLNPDSGAVKVSPIKVVGDWFFGLQGNDATPISKVDYSKAHDDALRQFAAGITVTAAKAKLTKLIAELIAIPAAREEMLKQLTATALTESAESVGAALAATTDTAKLKAFVDQLLAPTPAGALPSGAVPFAKLLFDNPRSDADAPSASAADNVGNRAIIDALLAGLTPPLPQNVNIGTDIPDEPTRFRRFFDYLKAHRNAGSERTLYVWLESYFEKFAPTIPPPAPPPPPPPTP